MKESRFLLSKTGSNMNSQTVSVILSLFLIVTRYQRLRIQPKTAVKKSANNQKRYTELFHFLFEKRRFSQEGSCEGALICEDSA